MIEIRIEEDGRLDLALKAFKRKMARSGILKDLRKKRFYVKPSEARAMKAAAAERRRRRGDRPPRRER
jgi:small subunit ribosomal protein S21